MNPTRLFHRLLPLGILSLAILNPAPGAEPGKDPAKPAAAKSESLDPERVKAVAAMLGEHATGVGHPITDRASWEKLAALPAYRQLIDNAEKFLAKPLPEQPDDLFLEFTRNGNRTHWQAVSGQRRGRLMPLVMAECLENKGRFLPAIEQLTAALCAEKTWVMPAHDRSLDNFKQKNIDIDLASSALGWDFATADWLLGDKLSAGTRQLIRENVRKRVLDPFRDMFNGKRKPNWWMLGTNNWNAVCLAGVTGAGLAMLESREERAAFIVAAEKYIQNSLAGYTPDGYCSEGLGYWNYGFGRMMLLSETIQQATGGKLDLFRQPDMKAPAQFGSNIQIINGVAPAFADCGITAKPAAVIMYYVNRRFGLGMHEYDELDPRQAMGDLFETALFAFPTSASETAPAAKAAEGTGLRTYFDAAGILIGRPQPGTACRLGVALKGGHNAEHHNHNDVGSYVVVVGERLLLLDPGGEVYTARTFSSKRYESKLLNSFGHAVPIVGGQLQKEGRSSQAKNLKTTFSDQTDTFQMDIDSAYPTCPDLKSLTRTFVYSRAGNGSLTVTDRVEFKNPQSFGTALITKGNWLRQEKGKLFIYDSDEAVTAEISAEGGTVSIQADQIHEDAAVQPTRLGINFDQPVSSASISVKITPQEIPGGSATGSAAGTGNLLRNGGFETGSWCWDLPKNSLGAISTEQVASGKSSLKITDHDKKAGSNILSAPIPAVGSAKYLLRGKVYHVAGGGIGLYVKFLDAKRAVISSKETKGSSTVSIGSATGATGKWESFAFPFQTPPETAAVQLWFHSGNANEAEAYLDDLEVVKEAGQ